MNPVTLLGLIAATLTTISFLPQAIKSWKTRSAKDLSLGMFATFCAGVLLWLIYGLLQQDLPIILSNAVTFVLALAILILKIKHG
jgi:MtN3 and saliva related transmembrane protein